MNCPALKSPALAVLPFVALFAGCPEHEPVAFLITQTVVPTSGCLFTSGGNSLFSGVVDLVINRSGYTLGLQLQNLMPEASQVNGLTATHAQLDANSILVTGAHVGLRASGLEVSLPSDMFVYRSLVLEPSDSKASAFDVMPPAILDALRNDPFFIGNKEIQDEEIKACLAGIDNGKPTLFNVPNTGREMDILVDVQVEGRTQSGIEVLTNVFTFTLKVCVGCLVTPGVDPTSYLLAAESAADPFCDANPGDSCNRGQDFCEEESHCIQQYNNTDQSIYVKLQQCANDPNQPSQALLGRYHPLCKDFKPYSAATVYDRLEHLRCLYGLERASAFCDVSRAPLYPPQPDNSSAP